jgi:hypothetical protein
VGSRGVKLALLHLLVQETFCYELAKLMYCLYSLFRQSIELCRTLENAGVSFLTVHARTPVQRYQPINEDALREIKYSVRVPLIANGDVKDLSVAKLLHEKTDCDGVYIHKILIHTIRRENGDSLPGSHNILDGIKIKRARQWNSDGHRSLLYVSQVMVLRKHVTDREY